MPVASHNRAKLMGRWLSIRSSSPLIRCGPGTNMRAGTTRTSSGVRVQPIRIASPPRRAPIRAAARGSASKLQCWRPSSCRASRPSPVARPATAAAEMSAPSRPAKLAAAAPRTEAANHRECRGVSASTLSRQARAAGRVEFTPAHLLQDLVDPRLGGRVVAKLSHPFQCRASARQGDGHATVGNRYVTGLVGQRPCRRREGALNRSRRFVVLQQQPAGPE